jgi:peroxiredoxin
MYVVDGVVKALNVETKGGVNVSGSETLLSQI